MGERSPASTQAAKHYRRGLEEFRGGRFRDAVRHIRKAVDVNPANVDWRYDLAVALQKAERHDEAAREYRRVLEAGGEAADALANLALCLRALGKLHDAELAAERAVALAPGAAEAVHTLGVIQDALARPGAIPTLERAVELSRGAPAVLNDLGVALDRAGEFERAEACFRKVLAIEPRRRDARENLSGVLYATGRVDEAEACAQALVADEPGSAEGHLQLALCHQCNGRSEAALAAARRCVALAPTAPHWNFVGQILRERDDPDGAIAAIREALRLEPALPDASLNLAHALLAGGRVAEGWAAYARRLKKTALPDGAGGRELRVEDAGALAGKRVLLVGEQGPGDELFFLRFAPTLRARGAVLAYSGDPRLVALLAQTGGFEALASREAVAPAADYAAQVGDLPVLLGDHEGLPRPPTLRLAAGPARRDRAAAALAAAGSPPYVLVTWQAGPLQTRREAYTNRTLFKRAPPDALGAALRHAPATVAVLQRSAAAADLEAFARALGRPAPDLTVRDDDLEALLALLELADEYVGVSNTNMHLRAAAGREARVLMPLPPDWRWGAAGEGSAWFPGFRVYRESPATGWEDALARLAGDLAASLAAQENSRGAAAPSASND